ncbi:MAG: SBBP repeat-containing protein [candidate division WOR-3 bacterium]
MKLLSVMKQAGLLATAMTSVIAFAADGPGDVAWTQLYNGPGNSNDGAVGIVVDAAGNSYVAGVSPGSGTGNDYVTIKYGPDGTPLWTARYNAVPGFEVDDEAYAIAVDPAGNAYVTGGSGIPPNHDFATVRYNADGSEAWVRRYDGASNTDKAVAITLDDSGNVYITGYSLNSSGEERQIVTIKYDASGMIRWLAEYRGDNNYAVPAAIAVDERKFAYVTGYTLADRNMPDIVTICYDSLGSERWVSTYGYITPGDTVVPDMGTDIVVNTEGVFVTGQSANGLPPSGKEYFVVLRYDREDGSRQWLYRYAGTQGTYHRPSHIRLDPWGNPIVTGTSAGSQGAHRNFDILTFKLNGSNGSLAWRARFDADTSDDYGKGLVVDGTGRAHVCGVARMAQNNDFVHLRYTPDGYQEFHKFYDTGDDDDGVALGIDQHMNAYITGKSFRGAAGYDMMTFRIDSGTGVAESYSGTGPVLGSIQVSPNPVRGQAQLRFFLPRDGGLSVKLYDAVGALASVLADGPSKAGENRLALDGNRLVPGVYVVLCEGPGVRATQKVLVK